MAKIYTAQSVAANHNWQFVFSDGGDISGLVIKGEVNYGSMGKIEQLDIWPHLSAAQKAQIQNAYNAVRTWFNNQFLD